MLILQIFPPFVASQKFQQVGRKRYVPEQRSAIKVANAATAATAAAAMAVALR